jgi:hypothetical protein
VPNHVFLLHAAIFQERVVRDQIAILAIHHHNHLFQAFHRLLKLPYSLSPPPEQVSGYAHDHSHRDKYQQPYRVAPVYCRKGVPWSQQKKPDEGRRSGCRQQARRQPAQQRDQHNGGIEKNEGLGGSERYIQAVSQQARNSYGQQRPSITLRLRSQRACEFFKKSRPIGRAHGQSLQSCDVHES